MLQTTRFLQNGDNGGGGRRAGGWRCVCSDYRVAGSKVCTKLQGSVSSQRELALDLREIQVDHLTWTTVGLMMAAKRGGYINSIPPVSGEALQGALQQG